MITANKTTQQVRINLTDKVSITSEDVDFENEFKEIVETKEYKHTQEENSITFGANIPYLETILKDIEGDAVRFELTSPNRGIKIDNDYLLMPTMLDA